MVSSETKVLLVGAITFGCLAAITIDIRQIISLLENATDKIAETQTQMANVHTQIVNTQSQMASALDQIVSMLQTQGQQLGNMSASLTTMVKQLNQQNQILNTNMPTDCSNVSTTNNRGSEVYTIDPRDGLSLFRVYCDMHTEGGGWIVLQRRFDSFTNFFQGWDAYEQGFGNVWGGHWLGLRLMHRLTSSGRWTLRIDLEDFNGNIKYAQYEDFQIGDAASFYQLSIGAYSGNVGYDALTYHNGQPFSTKDQDHDNCTTECQSYADSCALMFQGGWWYRGCHDTNLNGLYQGSTSPTPNESGSLMSWLRFSGSSGYISLKKSEMKIRQVQ